MQEMSQVAASKLTVKNVAIAVSVVLGGVVLLVAIGAIIYWAVKRRQGKV
jgi:hypothetical protein